MGIMSQIAKDKAFDNVPNLTKWIQAESQHGSAEKGYAVESELNEKGRFDRDFSGEVRIIRTNLFANDDGTYNFSMNLSGNEVADSFRVSTRFDPETMANGTNFPAKMQRQAAAEFLKFLKHNDLIDKDYDPEPSVEGWGEVCQAIGDGMAKASTWTVFAGFRASQYTNRDGEVKGPYCNLSWIRPEPVEKLANDADLPY